MHRCLMGATAELLRTTVGMGGEQRDCAQCHSTTGHPEAGRRRVSGRRAGGSCLGTQACLACMTQLMAPAFSVHACEWRKQDSELREHHRHSAQLRTRKPSPSGSASIDSPMWGGELPARPLHPGFPAFFQECRVPLNHTEQRSLLIQALQAVGEVAHKHPYTPEHECLGGADTVSEAR